MTRTREILVQEILKKLEEKGDTTFGFLLEMRKDDLDKKEVDKIDGGVDD